MASTYMNNYRQKCRAERDSKVSTEEYECRKAVNSLSSKYQKRKKWSDYLKPTGCASAVVGFFLLCALGPYFLVFGLLLWPILNFIIVPTKNQKIDSNNDEVSRQIQKREAACREQCKGYENECERQIAMEEKRYKSEVSQARKLYGGSVVMAPVVKWICDQYEPEIKAADRGISVKTITANFRYRVDSDQLVVLKWLPHSGTYYDAEKIIFDKGIGGYRYHNLPNLFHQIGFAQALAKQIEFEIISRYPHDPIAPAREHKPKIKIDYDDTSMVITYMVGNPNYRTQVSFGKGV